MTTDPAVSLAKWFSPSRPIRSFAFSNRLQWALRSNQLKSRDDVALWVETVLKDGTGFHDAVSVVSAYEAQTKTELDSLNTLYHSYCEIAQRRSENREQSAVFARVVRYHDGLDVSHLAYPIAVGHAASHTSKPLEMTLRFFLGALTSRLVASACKQVDLSDADVAAVERSMAAEINAVARKSMNLSTKDSVPTEGLVAALANDDPMPQAI